MYFVTTYEDYPIYEAAEGGYYYSGERMTDYRGFQSFRKARKTINRMYKQALRDGNFDGMIEYRSFNGLSFGAFSKYIGDGWNIYLENKLGENEHGYEPYC